MHETINTLSNQDFAGLDQNKVRTSLGKIKEMQVKMNKINKSNRNENSTSNFISSPFPPLMANLAAISSAAESASLTLDKRQSLESKPLRASSEKVYCLHETVSLLKQNISEKNQSRLKTDRELKILGKDFKKQMRENNSLALKLFPKTKK